MQRALQVDAGLLIDADAIANEPQRAMAAHVATSHQVALSGFCQIHHLEIHNRGQIGKFLQRLHIWHGSIVSCTPLRQWQRMPVMLTLLTMEGAFQGR
jgi:hypothetical protein